MKLIRDIRTLKIGNDTDGWLTAARDNRGDPDRDGITIHMQQWIWEPGGYAVDVAYVFLERPELERLRDFLNEALDNSHDRANQPKQDDALPAQKVEARCMVCGTTTEVGTLPMEVAAFAKAMKRATCPMCGAGSKHITFA